MVGTFQLDDVGLRFCLVLVRTLSVVHGTFYVPALEVKEDTMPF